MPNPFFQFKQFTVFHDRCAMKVTTDACFFGAWCSGEISQLSFQNASLLDIGTGSGLLSLMIAQKNTVQIDAVEIEDNAAQQAKENVNASPWKDRIHIYNQDILSFDNTRKYDLIVSNPPFYENELASPWSNKNLAHHSSELKMAEVIGSINERLSADGVFFLLYPFHRDQEIKKILDETKLHIAKKIRLQQTAAHAVFRVMIMGTRKTVDKIEAHDVCVYDGKQYSDAFSSVLEEYYLYL